MNNGTVCVSTNEDNTLQTSDIADDKKNGDTSNDILVTSSSHPEIEINGKLNATTEQLVPVIEVSNTVKKNKVTKLRRTFSVDHNVLKSETSKMYGSNDSISAKSPPSEDSVTSSPKSRGSITSSQTLLRRRSLTKNTPPLPKAVTKRNLESSKNVEKAVSTENLHLKTTAGTSKKLPARPRSQIVAAVTSRLYSKLRKHEVATDTHDISLQQEPGPKELAICSNARFQLRELSRRALRAHRSKTEETQTEGLPIAIVKEKATDVGDLQLSLEEVKEASTMSETVSTKDVGIDCCFKESESTSMISCGTQCEVEEVKFPHPISFTKYLRDFHELSNTPIYANSLNINISNNYMEGKKVNISSSEDSFEDPNPSNDGLPTPDLISNHNSLEQHHLVSGESSTKLARNLLKVLYETVVEVEDQFRSAEIVSGDVQRFQNARAGFVPKDCSRQEAIVNFSSTFATEIQTQYSSEDEHCSPLPRFQPNTARCDSIGYEDKKFEDCAIEKEPLVLKSIVKDNLSRPQFSSSEEDLKFKTDVMDSLEYHMVNKKVKFSEKAGQEKRMIKAMSEFLEEATQLMSKIDRCNNDSHDSNYEIEVTMNNVLDQKRGTRKSKKKKVSRSSVEKRDSSIQTFSPFRSESSTQCETEYVIPINKYESLLEDTCRRLEEKIQRIPASPPRDHHSLNEYMLEQDENPSDLDDSSLESNAIAFSDYGSLPRRRHKRYRRPACSPSAFLKQLTNMRRQVIRTSREDLMNLPTCHH